CWIFWRNFSWSLACSPGRFGDRATTGDRALQPRRPGRGRPSVNAHERSNNDSPHLGSFTTRDRDIDRGFLGLELSPRAEALARAVEGIAELLSAGPALHAWAGSALAGKAQRRVATWRRHAGERSGSQDRRTRHVPLPAGCASGRSAPLPLGPAAFFSRNEDQD